MDELLAQFLVEARELTAAAEADLAALSDAPGDAARLDSLFRAIHTLKGSVAIFDMVPAVTLLHAAEDRLGEARAGRNDLDDAALAALVACVDQVDRWVDGVEQQGDLPANAARDADRLVALLAAADAAAAPEAAAAWADAIVRQHGAALGEAGAGLVAFRYRPDPDCFFRGDDPVAVLAALPELAALSASPVDPWPALADVQPFHCNLVFEGLSTAPIDAVRAALRFVGDQAEVAAARDAGERGDAPADAGRATPRARSLRVDAAILDTLADDVGQLIVVGNTLAQVAAEAEAVDAALAARISGLRTQLEATVAGLRRTVGTARMAPIGPALRRLPRLVREAAAQLGREIDFTVAGEGTEIDRAIADALFEPLLHLLRNAVDHGIEPAEARAARGKPPRGALTLAAQRAGDSVLIDVADDGAGIDPAKMRLAAVTRGLLDAAAAEQLEDQQAVELVFAAGFSTAAAVSNLSGRGVGMDAVRATIERMGGRVDIASRVGHGTRIRLRLPLTAVTTRVLTVRVGDDQYAVPVEDIVETASVAGDGILRVGTGRAVVLRDRTLPFLSLGGLLGKAVAPAAVATRLLVTRASGEPVAIGVDGFGAQMDVMLRPPAGLLAAAPGFAGTTVLGDGRVLVALSLEELIG